jgi:hypothetical protein
MQIRTITAGAREQDIGKAAQAARLAKERLEAAGYTVQTLRLAITQASNTCADVATVARAAEEQALEAGFDYVSLGPVDTSRLPGLAEGLAATETVFASAQIATTDGVVLPETLRAAAEVMVALGATTEHGFGNLRFAALACVSAGSPFFPAAYHDRGEPWVAVGPEASALAVEATSDGRPATTDPLFFQTSLGRLTTLIEQHDAAISAALANLQRESGVRFADCDWSYAPKPDAACSVGAAVEALSGVPFGEWGTLAGVRGLTAAVRAAKVTQLGFSGVMLPVLEDPVLARRNTEGRYTLRDLLAFSAVCGTGLDTIPLPGNTSADEITGVLEEVAALASAYRKPLTARLMPIPGLQAGDTTAFEFAYFVNTQVMRLGVHTAD